VKKSNTIFLITAILLTACNESANINQELTKFDNLERSFKREIPSNADGRVSPFYTSTKVKQKYLGLDSLESGFDGLQIRIWYDDVYITRQKLLVIIYKQGNWAANFFATKGGATLSKESDKLIPKMGWINFSNKFLSYNVLTLPNGDDIDNCGSGGGDGSTFNVEIATQKHYRYYGYWEPQDYKDKCQEAKNMNDILNLIAHEFDIFL
jgi:hypothetical protein